MRKGKYLMKKLSFILILLLSLSAKAFALNGRVITAKDGRASLMLPDSYLVFHYNIEDDDPLLEQQEMSAEDVRSYLDQNEDDFEAFSPDTEIEVELSTSTPFEFKLDSLSPTAALNLAELYYDRYWEESTDNFAIQSVDISGFSSPYIPFAVRSELKVNIRGTDTFIVLYQFSDDKAHYTLRFDCPVDSLAAQNTALFDCIARTFKITDSKTNPLFSSLSRSVSGSTVAKIPGEIFLAFEPEMNFTIPSLWFDATQEDSGESCTLYPCDNVDSSIGYWWVDMFSRFEDRFDENASEEDKQAYILANQKDLLQEIISDVMNNSINEKPSFKESEINGLTFLTGEKSFVYMDTPLYYVVSAFVQEDGKNGHFFYLFTLDDDTADIYTEDYVSLLASVFE